jgi:hypothetical protein
MTIVKRETLFSESQNTLYFRNEKIEGDKATLEVKNSFGSWETVPFVREDNRWKIDKKGYADRMMQDSNRTIRRWTISSIGVRNRRSDPLTEIRFDRI